LQAHLSNLLAICRGYDFNTGESVQLVSWLVAKYAWLLMEHRPSRTMSLAALRPGAGVVGNTRLWPRQSHPSSRRLCAPSMTPGWLRLKWLSLKGWGTRLRPQRRRRTLRQGWLIAPGSCLVTYEAAPCRRGRRPSWALTKRLLMLRCHWLAWPSSCISKARRLAWQLHDRAEMTPWGPNSLKSM